MNRAVSSKKDVWMKYKPLVKMVVKLQSAVLAIEE